MVKRWIATFIAVICSFLGIYAYGEEQIEQGYALMEEVTIQVHMNWRIINSNF